MESLLFCAIAILCKPTDVSTTVAGPWCTRGRLKAAVDGVDVHSRPKALGRSMRFLSSDHPFFDGAKVLLQQLVWFSWTCSNFGKLRGLWRSANCGLWANLT